MISKEIKDNIAEYILNKKLDKPSMEDLEVLNNIESILDSIIEVEESITYSKNSDDCLDSDYKSFVNHSLSSKVRSKIDNFLWKNLKYSEEVLDDEYVRATARMYIIGDIKNE